MTAEQHHFMHAKVLKSGTGKAIEVGENFLTCPDRSRRRNFESIAGVTVGDSMRVYFFREKHTLPDEAFDFILRQKRKFGLHDEGCILRKMNPLCNPFCDKRIHPAGFSPAVAMRSSLA